MLIMLSGGSAASLYTQKHHMMQKLKIYKGTTLLSENILLDAPVSICTFFPDNSKPRTPSVAVAAGGFVFIYRNLRPYYKFTLPLLSDEDLAVHRAYGAYGEKKLYGKVVEGVIRSTFVVDEDGTVEVAQYNVKATGHVAKLRRDLGLD